MKRFNLEKYIYVLAVTAFLAFGNAAYAQEKTATTDDHDHDHQAMLMKNGEKEMGFSQTETTHHFLILKGGGAIQVEANASDDSSNRNKIRIHLKAIAGQFATGIFTTPFAVHGQIPPGVPLMDQLKKDIKYKYEETENGARIRISTDNPQALSAIQSFLKFQIEEHKTGDPLPGQK